MPRFGSNSVKLVSQPRVYHYRDLASFWEIIKSDSLWATNARFSNDEAEQQFGMEVISSVLSESEKELMEHDLGLDEKYIVCFCEENDTLSQWRGYAPEGGVSLGFDFGMPRVFSVLHNEKADEASECVKQYVGLDKVCYISPKQDMPENREYKEYCTF